MTESAIKKIRIQKGWTQEQLAEAAHVSTNSISNYERGTRCPRLIELKRIATAFHCLLSELIDQ